MNSLSLDQLLARLSAAGAPSSIVTDVMPVLCVLASSGARTDFAQGVDPDGKPWKPLAHPRPDGSNVTLRDKGLLFASIKATSSGSRLTLQASAAGANVHQYGATIRPKSAKALAIPLTIEAKRIGSPKQNHFPRPLFVYRPGPGRNAFLAERKGKRAKLVLQYVLLKQVTIPARKYLGFSRQTLSRMGRIVAEAGSRWAAGRFQTAVTRPFRVIG